MKTEPIDTIDLERKDFEKAESGLVERVCNALLAIAQILALLSLVTTSGLALVSTAHFPYVEGFSYNEHMELSTILSFDGLTESAAGLVCALLLVGVLFLIWKCRIGNSKPWMLLLVVSVWALAFQLTWIFSLNSETFIYADTLQLSSSASSLLSGDTSDFHSDLPLAAKGGSEMYFTMYPFQAGSLYLFLAVFRLFGANNIVAFEVINAVANVCIIVSLYWLTRNITASRKARNFCIILSGMCLPLLLSCAFVYGNTIGLLFSTVALGCIAQTLRGKPEQRVCFTVLGFASVAIAMALKSTCILFFIVIVILILIESVKQKSARLFAIVLISALLVQQVSALPTRILEEQTGSDFGDGMPKTSWIAMGLLSDNVVGMPGWWGLFPSNAMLNTDNNIAEQNKLALESIEESAKKFISNPADGANFFLVKLASEWSDPTFQTLYYSSLNTKIDYTCEYGRLATAVLYGNAHKPAVLYMDAYQLIIMFAALSYPAACLLLGAKRKAREFTVSEALLPSAIALGFVVYIFWEAKSIYALPFFVLMLPLASSQLDSLFTWLDKMLYGESLEETKSI